jgi:serine/threonine protein kinase
MDEGWQQHFGALTHAAPELVSGAPMTKAADVYSVGVLLWELLTGQVSSSWPQQAPAAGLL